MKVSEKTSGKGVNESLDPEDLVDPGLRAAFRIAEKWHLGNDDLSTLLGQPSRSTFFRWKAGHAAQATQDLLERLSYILGIYKGLHTLFSHASVADTWVSQPNDNPLFAGRSPLQRMLAGQVSDLYVVRQHVDAARGW